MKKLIENDGTALATEGQLWVCLACGKTSRSQYGFDQAGKRVADAGWDESCMLNCKLFAKNLLVFDEQGRVTQVKEKPNAALQEADGDDQGGVAGQGVGLNQGPSAKTDAVQREKA